MSESKNDRALKAEIRERFICGITQHLEDCGEEVLRVKSNEIALPVLDNDNNERWLVITFKVPSGTQDGDPYDGYNEAESYELEQKVKAEKAAARAEKTKQEQAKRDAKRAAANLEKKEGK